MRGLELVLGSAGCALTVLLLCADDKAAHDRLLAKAHAFCSKVASQFPATMRDGPPVPTSVPVHTPLSTSSSIDRRST